MALDTLTQLDKYKANRDSPFPPGYPENVRTFYSPVDDVHGALTELLQSAQASIIIAMYGYDDKQLNEVVRSKLESKDVFISLSLDKTQASGIHEKEILAAWLNNDMGNSVAIGRSARGAIMHLKLIIIDGVDVLTGSTNWSTGGQTKQDNQLLVIRDPLLAAEARARVDIIHDLMLKQMAQKAMKPAKAARRTRAPASDPKRKRRPIQTVG